MTLTEPHFTKLPTDWLTFFLKNSCTEIYENLTQISVADTSSRTDRCMDERTWSVHKGVLFLPVSLFTWASAASHGCTAASWLIVPPALDVPTLATRCPRAYRRVPHSSGRSSNLWAGNRIGEFCLNADFHGTFRVLLHAANLRHGTHGFTSLPGFGRFWTRELGYQRPAR
jgi:hypothetical protein